MADKGEEFVLDDGTRCFWVEPGGTFLFNGDRMAPMKKWVFEGNECAGFPVAAIAHNFGIDEAELLAENAAGSLWAKWHSQPNDSNPDQEICTFVRADGKSAEAIMHL